jgi:hypothetical protein
VNAEPGDKVRLKVGAYRGRRGTIAALEAGMLVVRLDDAEQVTHVLASDVTNYSLAARKAWITEPDRAVGRRKGTRLCDRVSVTLRIDRDLWQRFVELEQAGVIEDRTAAINRWLRDQLAELDIGELERPCPKK